MVKLLEKVSKEKFYVSENIYASSVRVAYYDSLWQQAGPSEKNKYLFQKAVNLLYGGQTTQAIQLLENLLAIKKQHYIVEGLQAYEEDQLEELTALAYLRLGEQENCILNHTAASCIIPIRPEGYHQLPQGSQQAIHIYQQLLKQNGYDHSSRWLLNVAYMTLGKYPGDVPSEWLIDESAFRSAYPLPRFKDIAPDLGLDDNRLAGGAITDDFNNDGFIDLMLTSWGANHQMKFFINVGNGTFTEKTIEAGLQGITGGLNMIQADYNNDNFLDVFILRGAWLEKLGGHPNSLLRNNGNGTFTDVTYEAGLLSFHPTQTAVWTDVNLDGWLDLFIGNESTASDNIHPCELFINQQNGTFKEVAQQANITVSRAVGDIYYVKGVSAADYNKDGWPDIYVSALDDRNRNLLFRNNGVDRNGIPTFTEVGIDAGLGETISSFPTWFWDYNNDGWPDIFAAGFRRSNPWESITEDVAAEYLGLPHQAETARLYLNRRDGTFTDVTKQAGLKKITYAMGANFGDMDNDGFLDMYLATGEVNFASIIPNRAFRNEQGTIFQDVTTSGGFGHLQKGHGVCFADLDNDGDQDIYVVMGGAYEGDGFQNALFQNPGNTHGWITLQLEGKEANRAAIGAQIKITVLDSAANRRIIYSTVNSGGSFGASSLQQEIGLGKVKSIEQVEITWPDTKQTTTLYTQLSLNKKYKIMQGAAKPIPVNIPVIEFDSSLNEHTSTQAHSIHK
ncbi:CRTAC1 family protein [Rhodocytophaga aerolata]|uniref:CRTAC1 family protein n=1 Tax=Rhodocytophaga aerolata TaxID=455078 RepID=A0ABT8RDB9_9BACT|nr:CRTAC1 family protein [Rhodocytophaga aerolata]MDO1448705.1 CRTAC1 family protein [Rhodocytophaga aerolata]